jgi:glycosyltransferase involved in cell wall biosynthesis
MRIVIDLQAAQASNKNRGIGRYSIALAEAMIRDAPAHDFVILLNGAFPESVMELRTTFETIAPSVTVSVWPAPPMASNWQTATTWQRAAAKAIREEWLESLKPDVVLVGSLFEGFNDSAVTSVAGSDAPYRTAVILFDLIPLIRHEDYLRDERMRSWYHAKIDELRQSELLLAISESSRQEAIVHLGLSGSSVVNISGAIGPHFRPAVINSQLESDIRLKFGLTRPFLMCTGGIDKRKNLERLIYAFSSLDAELRSQFQLTVVCDADSTSKIALQDLATECGLSQGDLVLTGHVTETELVSLYNLCHLFVFPSIHEGFGLPVLEAMACGRPVIASNTSSLPEIVDLEVALFDPFDAESIASKITESLTDRAFQTRLAQHGLQRADHFSWAKSARAAIDAIEKLLLSGPAITTSIRMREQKPRLAYVSPLPPERSGISDYSAELLPELSRFYEIDVIVNQRVVSDPWIQANLPIRDTDWFQSHHSLFDRVVYNFGNSVFHSHMFALLEAIPGVIILHDFYLSGIIAHMDIQVENNSGKWATELYKSHGYAAMIERFKAADTSSVVWKYPANLSVLQAARGVIVHSHTSRDLARSWYGPSAADSWAVVPLLRRAPVEANREAARLSLGITPGTFLVCSFGIAGPSKLSQRIVDVMSSSAVLNDPSTRLVFVGENLPGEYGAALAAKLDEPAFAGRATITGRVSEEQYRLYLQAADLAIQLRSFTQGETSAAVLDCMNYGVATIVNAVGSLSEIAADCVLRLDANFADADLEIAISSLRDSYTSRRTLGANGAGLVRDQHSPDRCSIQIFDHIEAYWRRPLDRQATLIAKLATIPDPPEDEVLILDAARAIARATPALPSSKQLFVDISEFVNRDSKTGIQRVTANIMRCLLESPPEGFRVEPVYATVDGSYRYARSFTSRWFGSTAAPLADELVEYHHEEIFLGLDLQPHVVSANREFFQELRRNGVQVFFVVYDLLPLLLPHAFLPGASEIYEPWLATVLEADGALTISQAVANDLQRWISAHGTSSERFSISPFQLGSDFTRDAESDLSPEGGTAVAAQVESPSRLTFLMVGTLEPRKCHQLVLDAFELLWASGQDVILHIVGKHGWMVEHLVGRIEQHPEFGDRLIWSYSVTDNELRVFYRQSTCLLAASEAEGFGLPLVEAARHGLPIIARDIEPFREVAGDNAFYFTSETPADLAGDISAWIELHKIGLAPTSLSLKQVSWSDSTNNLLQVLGLTLST